MSHLEFQSENTIEPPPADASLEHGFVLRAPPGTDLWSKPPSVVRSTAPTVYKAIPLTYFQRARVRVSAHWSTLYDQGGLVLILQHSSGEPRKWIKTGIEFVDGKPFVSTVTKDNWADWSLTPVPDGGNEVVIEMAREKGALWVYIVEKSEEGEKRVPVRAVTWTFAAEEDVGGLIGMYACRPSKKLGEDLAVSFHNFELELRD